MTSQPEIFIIETVQPSIEVAAGINAELEILEPSSTKVIEVNVPGPQGPMPLKRVKIDSTITQTIYIGLAEYGTAEADPVWTITRTTYSAAGVRLTKGTATGVTWTGRAGHTYT